MSAKHRFTVRFWGVRGSIPTPGPQTQAIGGNTSCLEIRCDDEIIILDAGSGIRPLGEVLAREGVRKATLLLSHVHWDHILGFPYFAPGVDSDNEFVIFGERKAGAGVRDILDDQSRLARAPIIQAKGGARFAYEDVEPTDDFKVGKASVKVGRMNHPDGCIAFRIDFQGHSVVYATDTEHVEGRVDARLVDLAGGADMLIYDAMYTEDEYRGEVGGSKKGWGHSTWNAGVQVADAAGVKRFFLFHHDPLHDDRFVERLEKDARRAFSGSVAAREGMNFNLLTGRVSRPRRKPGTDHKPVPGIATAGKRARGKRARRSRSAD